MLYDLELNIYNGNNHQVLMNCSTSDAIGILNSCFTIHNIDMVMTKHIFYNLISRPELAPKLIRHLMNSGQLKISKKYNQNFV